MILAGREGLRWALPPWQKGQWGARDVSETEAVSPTCLPGGGLEAQGRLQGRGHVVSQPYLWIVSDMRGWRPNLIDIKYADSSQSWSRGERTGTGPSEASLG